MAQSKYFKPWDLVTAIWGCLPKIRSIFSLRSQTNKISPRLLGDNLTKMIPAMLLVIHKLISLLEIFRIIMRTTLTNTTVIYGQSVITVNTLLHRFQTDSSILMDSNAKWCSGLQTQTMQHVKDWIIQGITNCIAHSPEIPFQLNFHKMIVAQSIRFNGQILKFCTSYSNENFNIWAIFWQTVST